MGLLWIRARVRTSLELGYLSSENWSFKCVFSLQSPSVFKHLLVAEMLAFEPLTLHL